MGSIPIARAGKPSSCKIKYLLIEIESFAIK
jgi:hypothetical protein